MPDNILSQDEVDALLKAVETGEIAIKKPAEQQKKCVKYDFKSPTLFSRENRDALAALHDDFARRLSSSLTVYLRTPVEVARISADQLSYGEFVLSLPEFPCINVVSLAPFKGSVLMEMNINILFACIERLLGGKAAAMKALRALTDVERAVAKKISSKVLEEYRAAWHGRADFTPRVEALESDSRFIQAARDDDSVLLTCFEIRIGGDTGILNVCFPPRIFESLMNALRSAVPGASGRKKDARNRGELRNRLAELPFPVSVVLARTLVTAGDAGQLKPGDMIRFRRAADDAVTVRVGPRDAFLAKAGSLGKRCAAVITRPLE